MQAMDELLVVTSAPTVVAEVGEGPRDGYQPTAPTARQRKNLH